MPGGKSPGPSIKGGKKGDKRYEDLKKEGHSKESAAKINNAAAQGPKRRSEMAKKAATTRKKRGEK